MCSLKDCASALVIYVSPRSDSYPTNLSGKRIRDIITIQIERGDDIILLASHFASRMALECRRKELPVFSDEVVSRLMNYSWPGNVRELKNVVERAVYRSEGPVITEVDFNPFRNPYSMPQEEKEEKKEESTGAASSNGLEAMPLEDFSLARQQLDLVFLSRALEKSGGNQKTAAGLLGLSYDQFRGLYRKYRDLLNEKDG